MISLSNFKAEYLFLLVGKNPLPNYVAAKLLGVKSKTRFYLIHSKATENYAGYLKAFLQAEFGEWSVETLEIKESNPASISAKIENYFKGINNGKVNLNYTGGTKAMAVHSYFAVKKLCEDKKMLPYFSYLNPRELELRFDHLPGRPFKLGDPNHHTDAEYFEQCSINLRCLLFLHGYEPRKAKPEEEDYFENPRAQAWLPNLAQCLFNISMNDACLKEWLNWVGHLRQSKGEKKWQYRSRVSQCKLPLVMSLNAFCEEVKKLGLVNSDGEFDLSLYPANVPKTNESLASRPPAFVFAEWLLGKWLEDYTLHAIVNLKGKGTCPLNDYGASLEPATKNARTEPFFELDVVALRGYQLFAISCTTSSNKKECKLKLIEAFVRAHQLGGDEACVGLVCMSDAPSTLRDELETDLNIRDRIRVFGRRDLLKLEERLKEWFNGN